MNLDELQSIRDRERQSDSLQQLRESFYSDAGEFVEKLREEREAAADRADDPFDSPEVNRLSDDIKTAEQTVEAIYERRVGKLVKMASFAAADMPTEDEGLTAEERKLFEQLVASIEQNREAVFDILDGKDVDVSGSPVSPETNAPQSTPDPTGTTEPASSEPSASEGVDAADLMGSGGDSQQTDAAESPPDSPQAGQSDTADRPDAIPPDEPPAAATPDEVTTESSDPTSDNSMEPDVLGSDSSASSEQSVESPPAATAGVAADSIATRESADSSEPRSDGGPAGVERTTVRITQDVGEILGGDEREYDLSRDDVVTLPATNVEPLIQRDAAERLD